MPEKTPVVEDQLILYEGYFDLNELYNLINDLVISKGYAPVEARMQEVVAKTGKHVECLLLPFKKLSDYAKSEITIKISISECTDVVIKKAGKSKKLKQGKVHISLSGYLITDYEAKWEYSYLYALRVLFEKYIYRPLISDYSKKVKEDVEHFHDQIKAFLNIQRM